MHTTFTIIFDKNVFVYNMKHRFRKSAPAFNFDIQYNPPPSFRKDGKSLKRIAFSTRQRPI